MNRFRQSGMTLLEILVALGFFSVAVIAILDTVASTSRQVVYLENRTLAHWVASNELEQVRLDTNWPSKGVRRSEVQMADRTWYVSRRVEGTARNDMRRMIVEVRATPDGEIYSQRDWFFGQVK